MVGYDKNYLLVHHNISLGLSHFVIEVSASSHKFSSSVQLGGTNSWDVNLQGTCYLIDDNSPNLLNLLVRGRV